MARNSASNRLERLKRAIRQQQLPALLVSSPINVTYVTGFTGDSSYLVVGNAETAIFSDSRFSTQLDQECPDLKRIIKGDSGTTLDSISEYVNHLGISGIGFESHVVTKAAFDDLSSRFSCELVATRDLVESMRAVKDHDEIELVRAAIRINEQTFQVIRAGIRGDQTERQIGNNLEYQMRLFGAEGCAFTPIVGVGARSALPHATLTNQKVSDSPFLLVDWGTRNAGYVSDMTRMLISGKLPAKVAKIYEVVRGAQAAAIKEIRDGVDCQTVDRAARGFIDRAGFGKFFGHGLGHGIGMQVHESPYFSPTRKGVLAEGMIVTVEPGIYLPEVGGVRLEEDVLVTRNGCEVLSSLPNDIESAMVDLL